MATSGARRKPPAPAGSVTTFVLPLFFTLVSGMSLAGATTVALVSGEGERAPQESALAQVEAALSGDPAIALVERQQIRKVLAEQKLAVSGLADPATAVRLGQLLSAELFLFIEKLPVQTPVLWRAQVVEARSGVVLHSVVDVAESLASNPSALGEAVRLATTKSRTPPERRHHVGLLGVRSEESDRGLAPLAAALSSLLAADLNASPDLVLLDREHLQDLREEERLTGREASLRTSTVLIEAGIKQEPDTNRVVLNLVFRPLTDGEITHRRVAGLARDVHVLRRQASAAVCEHLKAAAPANTAALPRDEAIVFARRAQVLRSFGQAEEAVRAGEAAAALYPHPAICGVARECVNAFRSGLLPPVFGLTLNGRLLREAYPGQKFYPTETRVRLLRAALREFDLEDLGREFTALHSDQARQRLPLYLGGAWSSGIEYSVEIHPDEAEVMQLRQELFERTLARHLRRLDEFARGWNDPLPDNLHGDHPQLFWIKEIWDGVSRLKFWAINDQQWAKHIQAEIDRALNPPGPLADRWGSYKTLAWLHFSEAFQVYSSRPTEERQFVRQVLENLSGQTNAIVHLAVRHALFCTRSLDASNRTEALVDAYSILDVFLREMPLTHPVRQWDLDRAFPRSRVEQALFFLSDDMEKKRYAQAILDPMIEAHDWQRLEEWRETLRWHTGAMSAAERRTWAERLLTMVHAASARDALPEDGPIEKFLKQEVPDRWPPRDWWAPYEARPLLADALPSGEIMASTIHRDDLILVWVAPAGTNQAVVTVTRLPLAGGPSRMVGQLSLPSVNTGLQSSAGYTSTPDGRSFLSSRGRTIPHVCRVTADDQAVYVATLQGGLSVFRPGMAQAFTRANGLPADEIHALAVVGGKLFLGGHGLFEMDPATERFRELASNVSSQNRNPIDGGLDYRVTTLIADEEGGQPCLKIGTTVHGSGHGGWHYHLATDRFERLKRWDWNPLPRPRLGVEEFEGGDGLFVFSAKDQPPRNITRLPDGRPLSPIRAIHEARDQLVLTLPREVWSIRHKLKRQIRVEDKIKEQGR